MGNHHCRHDNAGSPELRSVGSNRSVFELLQRSYLNANSRFLRLKPAFLLREWINPFAPWLGSNCLGGDLDQPGERKLANAFFVDGIRDRRFQTIEDCTHMFGLYLTDRGNVGNDRGL